MYNYVDLLGGYIFIPIIFPKYEASVVFLFPLCIGAMFQCFYLAYVNILFFTSARRI